MKRFWVCLKKGIWIIVLFLLIGFGSGVSLANAFCHDSDMIHFEYRYTEELEVNLDSIISDENIQRVKNISKSWYTGGNISTYSYVNIRDISISKSKDGYLILVNKDSFIIENKEGKLEYNDTCAKGFLKHLILSGLDEELITKYNNQYSYKNDKGKEIMGVSTLLDVAYYESHSLDSTNHLLYSSNHAVRHYMMVYGLIGLGCGLFASILFVFIFMRKADASISHEYDNIFIYKTPFHVSFFKDSLLVFKDIKKLCIISCLLACVMISKFIPIPSGFGDLGISFGYLFLSIACMISGPIPALMIGFLSDVIGYMIRPDGMFFIGYTIQSMLACFFYALCFYKTHITFTRCLVARFLVGMICNVCIGSLCYKFMYSLSMEGLWVYIYTISLPKNLIYLIPQSLVLFAVMKAVVLPMRQVNLVDPRIAENISFF